MAKFSTNFMLLTLLIPAAFALLSCSSKEEDPLMSITVTPAKPYLIMGKAYSCEALTDATDTSTTEEVLPDVTGPYARFNVTFKNISQKTLKLQYGKVKFKSSAMSGDVTVDFSTPVSTEGSLVDTYEPEKERIYLGGAYADSDGNPTGCWPLITGFTFTNQKKTDRSYWQMEILFYHR